MGKIRTRRVARELTSRISQRRAALVALVAIFIFNIADILEYVNFAQIVFPPSAYDEAVILAATLLAFFLLWLSWKREALASEIGRTNRFLILLFAIMLAAEILALFVEWNTAEISDEPYMIIFILLGLMNSLWGPAKNSS
ncbi:MAG: hypothetical protein KGH65_04410 [Candidatus Micrarchaeota archaeon]|nr:hypothetical protein [Candidatus Micrarchaeota archaeon]